MWKKSIHYDASPYSKPLMHLFSSLAPQRDFFCCFYTSQCDKWV